MATLKEYKIYFKVKAFIETEGCYESDIIPRLINGVAIIAAYVPLIIESNGMEPCKYYSLSAAASNCGFLKQMIIYAHRNRCMIIARRKRGTKVFRIEWLASPPLTESHSALGGGLISSGMKLTGLFQNWGFVIYTSVILRVT